MTAKKLRGHSYPVMEDYYTIQGEGTNTGTSAYFIRLGGCDVGCPWCDVKESWPLNGFPRLSPEQMLKKVLASGARTVVITGGEPLLHDLSALCQTFRKKKIRMFLETSGAYSMSGEWDWICVSPKKFRPPLASNLRIADELKVIVFNSSDFTWAEQQAKKVKKQCRLYLQPEWGKAGRMLREVIAYVKQNHTWKISLQTHKYINIP